MVRMYHKYFTTLLICFGFIFVIAAAFILPKETLAQIQDQALSNETTTTENNGQNKEILPSIINNALIPITSQSLITDNNTGSNSNKATTSTNPITPTQKDSSSDDKDDETSATTLESRIKPGSTGVATTTPIAGESRPNNTNNSANKPALSSEGQDRLQSQESLPKTSKMNSTPAVMSDTAQSDEIESAESIIESSEINPLSFISNALSPHQEYAFQKMDPETTKSFMILSLTLASLGILLMGGAVEFIERIVSSLTEKTGRGIDSIKKPQKKYSYE